MFDSEFLISEETLKAAIAYKKKIENQGIKIAGERLSAILAEQAKPVDNTRDPSKCLLFRKIRSY